MHRKRLTDAKIYPGTNLNRYHKPGERTRWHDNQKLEAVKLWMACGSPTAVAIALKIPLKTIERWKMTDWWKKAAEDIRTEGSFQLGSKLKSIVDKSLEVVMDRIENGDWIYNQKTGEMVRKPVSLRDVHKVASDFIDKSQTLENKPQKEAKQTEDRLAQLADAFAQFAKKTTKIEVIDAIPIERETRLLEGEEVGGEPSPAGSGSNPENESSPGDGETGESLERRQSSGGSHQTSESWRFQLPVELESDLETQK